MRGPLADGQGWFGESAVRLAKPAQGSTPPTIVTGMEPTQRRVERESRVRTLQSDYYAMEDEGGQAQEDGEPAAEAGESGGGAEAADPFDLDGPGFDADRSH